MGILSPSEEGLKLSHWGPRRNLAKTNLEHSDLEILL